MGWLSDKQAALAGLSPQDVEWANKLGEKYGMKEEYLGKGDAARHLALGYLSAKAVVNNPEKARGYFNPIFLADLREMGLDTLIPGYENLSNEMDRKNNNLGHSIATLAKTNEEAAALIDKMIQTQVTAAKDMEQLKASKGPVIIGTGVKPYTGAPYGRGRI